MFNYNKTLLIYDSSSMLESFCLLFIKIEFATSIVDILRPKILHVINIESVVSFTINVISSMKIIVYYCNFMAYMSQILLQTLFDNYLMPLLPLNLSIF